MEEDKMVTKNQFWNCQHCTFQNSSETNICEVCHKTSDTIPTNDIVITGVNEETQKSSSKTVDSFKEENLDESWQCTVCTFINSKDTNICNSCSMTTGIGNQALKPENDQHIQSQSGWTCKFCTFNNSDQTKLCLACGKTGTHFLAKLSEPSSELSYVLSNERTLRRPVDEDQAETTTETSVILTCGKGPIINQPIQPLGIWTCQFCTFNNSDQTKLCLACGKTGTHFLAKLSENNSESSYSLNNERTVKQPVTKDQAETKVETDVILECSKGPAINQQITPQGVWTCQFCTFSNSDQTKICLACGKTGTHFLAMMSENNLEPNYNLNDERNMRQPVTEDQAKSKAETNGILKFSKTPEKDKQIQPRGDWICQFCTLSNSDETKNCLACGKPGTHLSATFSENNSTPTYSLEDERIVRRLITEDKAKSKMEADFILKLIKDGLSEKQAITAAKNNLRSSYKVQSVELVNIKANYSTNKVVGKTVPEPQNLNSYFHYVQQNRTFQAIGGNISENRQNELATVTEVGFGLTNAGIQEYNNSLGTADEGTNVTKKLQLNMQSNCKTDDPFPKEFKFDDQRQTDSLSENCSSGLEVPETALRIDSNIDTLTDIDLNQIVSHILSGNPPSNYQIKDLTTGTLPHYDSSDQVHQEIGLNQHVDDGLVKRSVGISETSPHPNCPLSTNGSHFDDQDQKSGTPETSTGNYSAENKAIRIQENGHQLYSDESVKNNQISARQGEKTSSDSVVTIVKNANSLEQYEADVSSESMEANPKLLYQSDKVQRKDENTATGSVQNNQIGDNRSNSQSHVKNDSNNVNKQPIQRSVESDFKFPEPTENSDELKLECTQVELNDVHETKPTRHGDHKSSDPKNNMPTDAENSIVRSSIKSKEKSKTWNMGLKSLKSKRRTKASTEDTKNKTKSLGSKVTKSPNESQLCSKCKNKPAIKNDIMCNKCKIAISNDAIECKTDELETSTSPSRRQSTTSRRSGKSTKSSKGNNKTFTMKWMSNNTKKRDQLNDVDDTSNHTANSQKRSSKTKTRKGANCVIM